MAQDPRKAFEAAIIAERVAGRIAEVYTGIFNTKGKWYRQDFSDIQQFFQASGENLKNGNAAGMMVTKDLNRPRAKPRAKKISLSRYDQQHWKAVDEKDVPDEIKKAV
jgi:hypothetical protein